MQLKDVLRVVIKYSYFQQSYSIKNSLDISKCSVNRILKKLINIIPDANYEKQKLGGPGFIVQVDETMLNFKCKSHRGRSPNNIIDALCIMEFKNKITRCFATIINNKEAKTIIPIICSQVVPGSIIHTDEHKSYSALF